MYFQGLIPQLPDGETIPKPPRHITPLPLLTGVSDRDVWLQAEADRLTDHASAARVRARFAARLLAPGEPAPPLPPFGRYIYPHLAFPLVNAYFALTGRPPLEPEILIADRLRHATPQELRALLAHEVGHHLSVHIALRNSRRSRRRLHRISLVLTLTFLLSGMAHILTGTPTAGTAVAASLSLLIAWLFVAIPTLDRICQERQRRHWEFLAHRWGRALHGPDYDQDLDRLRRRYLSPAEYAAAQALDRTEQTLVRHARNRLPDQRLRTWWRRRRPHKMCRGA